MPKTGAGSYALLNLPLRNGNFGALVGVLGAEVLLNLPLRNGNPVVNSKLIIVFPLLNLPLRNGNRPEHLRWPPVHDS